MIGSFGLWSSSKGMKVVSNLVGLDKTVAAAKIVEDGFTVGTSTAYNSSDPSEASNNNKIRSQDPTSGTLFTYELPINTVYTAFSFVPFSVFGFSPFAVFGFGVSGFTVFGFR
jgi:beta-lactam-binding protein with PASTA domain